MRQHKFAFGATVEASINVPRNSVVDLLRAAKWPAIAAIPGFVIYFTMLYLTYGTLSPEPTAIETEGVSIQFSLFSMLSAVPLMMIGVAFSYNWQQFLMNGPGDDNIPDPMSSSEPPEWWAGYRASLVKAMQLALIFMVPFLLIFWGLFSSIPAGQTKTLPPEDAWSLFGPMLVWAGVVIVSLPYALRASLVFPAIAAGLPDPTFRNALAVSKGMGWRIVGTYMAAGFALVLMILLGMIALMILTAIIGGIAVLVGGSSAAKIVIVPFVFVFYIVAYLYMGAFYAGFPALVLMQILPDFEHRWKALCAQPFPEAGSSGPPDKNGPISYGSGKNGDRG